MERDMMFDYFGARTLIKSYLLRAASGQIMELPQRMYMRVAIAVHGQRGTLEDILGSATTCRSTSARVAHAI